MNILAISGSARAASTNTAFLRALGLLVPAGVTWNVCDRLDLLPVFNPDNEGANLPQTVRGFATQVAHADGIVIASPEYIRAIPGGLKNAIDWLVSGDGIIGKPIVMAHASHRGDDMIASLRLVLSTVSSGFDASLFLRVPLLGLAPEQVPVAMREAPYVEEVERFVADVVRLIRAAKALPPHPLH